MQDETRYIWAEKFGLRVFKGYGTTETEPVIAANTPMDCRGGSVARLSPGIEPHPERVAGVDGGRLQVRGPNIMLGYLRAESPGVLEPPATVRGEGWYDTGDIVEIDGEGYIWIKGRAKRFAKIGGEMISLSAVEALAGWIRPDAIHAALSLPDANKGNAWSC